MVSVRCTASALKIRSLPVLDDGADTGKRFIRDQTAVVYGTSYDAAWFYVDAPQGRGWVHRDYVVTIAATLPTPAWPKVPNGRAEIERLFGSPGNAMAQAGRCVLPAPLKLSWSNESVRRFACHKLVEDALTSAFAVLAEKDLYRLLFEFGGCYNYRQVKASQKISTHAWGIAVDLNPKQNPLGSKPVMDQRVVAVFRDHGFSWGGVWSRPDGMHFQYATGY